MTVSISTNIPQVIAGMTAFNAKFDQAVLFGNRIVALKVERQAVKNADTGHHPRGQGHIPGTGPGPNTVSTSLKQSIRAEDRSGFGNYEIIVGATVEYARAVELGSPKWKSGVKYPYMRPAAETIRPQAARTFVEAMTSRLRG
jgi:hypothetical protein